MKLSEEEKAARRARAAERKTLREADHARREAEKQAQLTALRKVRDDESSTAEMIFEAVKMIEELGGRYYY